jgi:hypothetical protein
MIPVDGFVPGFQTALVAEGLQALARPVPHFGCAILHDADGQVRPFLERRAQVGRHPADKLARIVTRRRGVAHRPQRLAVGIDKAHRPDVGHAPVDVVGRGRTANARPTSLGLRLRRRVFGAVLDHRRRGAVQADRYSHRIVGHPLRAPHDRLDARALLYGVLGNPRRDALQRRPRRGQPVCGVQRLAVGAHVVLRVAVRQVVGQRGCRALHEPRRQLQRDHDRAVVHARLPKARTIHMQRATERVVGVRPGCVFLVRHAVHNHLVAEAVAHRLQVLLQELAHGFVADRERLGLALAERRTGQRLSQGVTDLAHGFLHFGLGENVASIQHGSGLLRRRSLTNLRHWTPLLNSLSTQNHSAPSPIHARSGFAARVMTVLYFPNKRYGARDRRVIVHGNRSVYDWLSSRLVAGAQRSARLSLGPSSSVQGSRRCNRARGIRSSRRTDPTCPLVDQDARKPGSSHRQQATVRLRLPLSP